MEHPQLTKPHGEGVIPSDICVAGMGELAQGHMGSESRRTQRYNGAVFGGVITLWDWHSAENGTIGGTFIHSLHKYWLSRSGVGAAVLSWEQRKHSPCPHGLWWT